MDGMQISLPGSRDQGGGHSRGVRWCWLAVGPKLPEPGASADLAGSNNTTIKGANCLARRRFLTGGLERHLVRAHLALRYSREHAMASILSGIVLQWPHQPTAGTFLQFSDYMRPGCGTPGGTNGHRHHLRLDSRFHRSLARTGPPINRSNISRRCGPSRNSRWSAPAIRMRPPTRGRPSRAGCLQRTGWIDPDQAGHPGA